MATNLMPHRILPLLPPSPPCRIMRQFHHNTDTATVTPKHIPHTPSGLSISSQPFSFLTDTMPNHGRSFRPSFFCCLLCDLLSAIPFHPALHCTLSSAASHSNMPTIGWGMRSLSLSPSFLFEFRRHFCKSCFHLASHFLTFTMLCVSERIGHGPIFVYSLRPKSH